MCLLICFNWNTGEHFECNNPVLYRTLSQNDTILKNNIPGCTSGYIRFMSDKDNCFAFVVKLLKKSHNFIRCPGIEVSCSFIGKNHYRIINKRPGNSNSLLLAS